MILSRYRLRFYQFKPSYIAAAYRDCKRVNTRRYNQAVCLIKRLWSRKRVQKKTVYKLLITFFIILSFITYHLITTTHDANQRKIEIQKLENHLGETKTDLQKTLDDKTGTEEQLKTKTDDANRIQQELDNLKAAKAAKSNAVFAASPSAPLPPGSHQDWLKQAGIAESDYGYATFIIEREGNWCPTRWNGQRGDCLDHVVPNIFGSGAYGVCQALPGDKMVSAGADWALNPITQLRWCDGYAKARYGGWAQAYSYWLSNSVW